MNGWLLLLLLLLLIEVLASAAVVRHVEGVLNAGGPLAAGVTEAEVPLCVGQVRVYTSSMVWLLMPWVSLMRMVILLTEIILVG